MNDFVKPLIKSSAKLLKDYVFMI